MKNFKKMAVLFIVSLAMFLPVSSSTVWAQNASGSVGISMPTRDNARWIREADVMTEFLANRGYATEIQFANNNVASQVNQIENMIVKGVKALVISSVDGSALTSVLEDAKAANIPVIAYTRLILNTDAVSYYTTFDYRKYGALSATSALQGLGLIDEEGNDTGATGNFNIELVGGSPTDNVAFYIFDGALEVLQPFLDSGSINVVSGQESFEQTATLNWDGETAQRRMEDILAANYTDGKVLNAVWVPYDGLTRGVISALQDAGYTIGETWPILPGGDAELDSVKAILSGEQYSTSFTDTRALAKAAASLVADLLDGREPGIEFDELTYDNGAKIIPSLLLDLTNVKRDDIVPVLVDSGFYTAEELGLQ